MNRIDTQTRVTRNLAIIRYQLEELSRQGLYAHRFTEELVQHTLNSTPSHAVWNLNTKSNNFPGIDLLSSDETVGYQVTRHVTKAKYDKTSSALSSELGKRDSRVSALRDVYVVGITSVNNPSIHRWALVDPGYPVRIRAVELSSLLNLSTASSEALLALDDVIQGFVNDWGRPQRSDADEIPLIVGWLDRPAVRDSRALELSWADMNSAMQGIRRLLAQGVDDLGHPVSRPMSTFREPFNQNMKVIYDASHQISRLLAPHLQGNGALTSEDVDLIDGLRVVIQRAATSLCVAAGTPPPQW